MVLQQNTNGFPAHWRPQLPFRRFLGNQTYAPPRPAFGRRAANHGHDPLLLARVQYPRLARTRLFVQSRVQPLFFVPPGNRSYRLRRYTRVCGHLRHPLSTIELAQDGKPAAALAPAPDPCSASRSLAADPASSTQHAHGDRFACSNYDGPLAFRKVSTKVHLHIVTDLVRHCAWGNPQQQIGPPNVTEPFLYPRPCGAY